jgi:putative tryptophan/tyrosine transport system substrate-binding protein
VLRGLGDVEGQNLTIERYSGEGRPAGDADLARDVIGQNPEVIVAISPLIGQAIGAATSTIPIVASGGYAGLQSLARPGGNITGIGIDVGFEIYGKRLQILKEAVPSASKVAVLDIRAAWESADGRQRQKVLREASRVLGISLIDKLIDNSTASECQRVFAEIVRDRPDSIFVMGTGELFASLQLIVELVEKSRLPAIYQFRQYVEAGGLMSYGTDFPELWRRLAEDAHQILKGAKPGDIPIYYPTTFQLVINLKAAKAIGLTIPPAVLARADEVIE